jgi:H+/gluconate symporter-like permease
MDVLELLKPVATEMWGKIGASSLSAAVIWLLGLSKKGKVLAPVPPPISWTPG